MKCFMCNGSLQDQRTNFIADLNGCIIIIKNVPSQVCDQCGEVTYDNEVVKKLEKIINECKNILTEIVVVHYGEMAA